MTAVLDKNGKPMRLVGVATTAEQANTKVKQLRVCNCNNNELVAIAEHMVTEMIRNPFTEEGKR